MRNDNELNMPVSLADYDYGKAKIKVIGVGGGGGNAINNMIKNGLKNIGFIAINTDSQALDNNLAPTKIKIGEESTRGLGAGADPLKGEAAALESKLAIQEALADTDMVFITCGMGGGTGTGASSIIAGIGRDLGILVVSIVTTPFPWEGPRRLKVAYSGIKKLRDNVDALIVIHNKQLLQRTGDNSFNQMHFQAAFEKVNEVLLNGTRGITDIIFNHSMINVDFADVYSVMHKSGNALMGIGLASGDNRALDAARNALNSPFLDNQSIKDAKGVLVKLSGQGITMDEIDDAMNMIREAAGVEVITDFDEDYLTCENYEDIDNESHDANVIFGLSDAPELGDKMQVTLIATGLEKCGPQVKQPAKNILKQAIEKVEETEPEMAPEEEVVSSINNDYGHIYRTPVNFPNYSSMEARNSSTNVSIPKGNVELSKFDIPASLRKNGTYSSQMLKDN